MPFEEHKMSHRRVLILLAATVGMLALPAAPVWAAPATPPVAVHVSPSPVVAGHTVTLSGSVGSPESVAGSACATGVSLLSRAFDSTEEFADVPALGAAVRPDGTFTITTIIPRSRAAGTYPITGRCGGANFGGATLVVRAATPAPPAALRVSPSSVTAGDRVTLSGSVGPEQAGSECARVTLYSNAFAPTNDSELPTLYAAATPDGTFATTTTIPRSKPAGTYRISAHCEGIFAGATLEVRAAVSPTTTSVTPPQVAAPAVTGPPSQPATTAAAQPASSWIIPGLGALGSGTLAAIGVWLLYRRRHPAGSSRRGRSRMAH